MPRRAPFLATTAAALLIAAAPAPGATTVGSDLTKAVEFGGGPVATFTVVNRSLPGRPTIAPFDGEITRWRVKGSGADWGTLRLRVMREITATPTYAAIASSAPETPGVVIGTREFATSLPIEAGDYIGLEATNQVQGAADEPGVLGHYLAPSPVDGGVAAPVFSDTDDEVFFNADIEPDDLGLQLRGRKRQPLKRLNVKASCFDDACDARITGKIVSAHERFKLKRRKRSLEPGAIHRIGLRVKSRGGRRELKKLLAEGARAIAKIEGKATTADGRADTAKKRIRATG